MHPWIGRAVDAFLSRGEGLDERGDPFGPPLSSDETDRQLRVVREARYEEAGPPFRTPLPLADTDPRVHVVLQPPPAGASGAWALLAPPYGAFARPADLGLYAMHARALRRRGLGVAAIALPYHGERVMPGRPSGWGFVRADLGHTSRALVAAAAETMALARWLREARGATRLVGLGVSLGGAALGLAAALGAPVDRLAFLAAVDNPAAFYATGRNREARRHTLRKAGYDAPRIVEAFRRVSPSSHAPPPAPALWAIPAQDAIVPAPAQDAWRAAWGGEAMRLRWEGHGVALASPVVARRLARWLAPTPALVSGVPAP